MTVTSTLNTSSVPTNISFASAGASSETLKIIDTTTTDTVSVIPFNTVGNLNPVVQAGDSSIVSSNPTGGIGTQPLTITPWSATSSGVRLTGTTASIGAGGSGATPTSNISFSGTNATLTGELTSTAIIRSRETLMGLSSTTAQGQQNVWNSMSGNDNLIINLATLGAFRFYTYTAAPLLTNSFTIASNTLTSTVPLAMSSQNITGVGAITASSGTITTNLVVSGDLRIGSNNMTPGQNTSRIYQSATSMALSNNATSGSIDFAVYNATPTLITPMSINSSAVTINEDLILAGVGNRILGDFSNATNSNRCLIQTSTLNSNTIIGAIPNGTGSISAYRAYNSSDANNSMSIALTSTAASCGISSAIVGSGTYQPMTIANGGVTALTVSTAGLVSFSNNIALQTTAPNSGVDGYLGYTVLLTGNVAINTPATNTPKSVNSTGLSLNPGTYTINMRGRHVTVGTGGINSISIGLTTTADSFTGGTSGLPVYGFFAGQNNANILYNMTRVLTVTVAGSYFLTVSCSYGASQAPTITGTDFSAQIVRIA